MTEHGPPRDPLDRIVETLMRAQGEGADISNIEIELRERGPEQTVISASLKTTSEDLNRAGGDAAELLRAEASIEQPTVMTADAMPPGELDVADVTQDAIEALGPQLDDMNAAYDADPDSVRPKETAAEDAILAAYYAYRAAAKAYGEFQMRAALAAGHACSYVEPKDAKDVVKGVIVGVAVAIVVTKLGVITN